MGGSTDSLLDAEIFGRGFEHHPVNGLFGELDFIKANAAFVAGFGLLHLHIKPILLLHGIATAFVVTRLEGLVVEFAVGIMEGFASEHTGRCAANHGVGIIVRQLTAEGRTAGPQRQVGGGSGDGGTAGKQAGSPGKDEDQHGFIHKFGGLISAQAIAFLVKAEGHLVLGRFRLFQERLGEWPA